MRLASDGLLAIGEAVGKSARRVERGTVAAAARASGRREFDRRAEWRVPLGFTNLASSVPTADPAIRSEAGAAVDHAIRRKDE
jgi:hypothetical protein